MSTTWVPIESNPDVMTKFIHKLGVKRDWCLVDVYGLDPDALAMVPQPVVAVILLYPISKTEAQRSLSDDDEQGEKNKDASECKDPKLFHMKQYIHNACGTIALIHSIANNLDQIKLEDGILKTFLDKAKDLSFIERGKLLMESEDICTIHKDMAQEGQTEAPGADSVCYHHYVAFVHKNGVLYELDGCVSNPIVHGATNSETLLGDAARVCKEYMSRDPKELSFTILALVNNEC